jgi:hypothetical protein
MKIISLETMISIDSESDEETIKELAKQKFLKILESGNFDILVEEED